METVDFPLVAVPAGSLSAAGLEVGDRVVWLRGEHDIFTAPALSATLAQVISSDDGDLVVDLSGVEFMDVATVGAIVRARQCLEGRSRSLALRSPSTRARRVLELCGVETGDAGPPAPARC